MWVITGDKQETAINIAISCKLLLDPDSLMICNATTYEGAHLSAQTSFTHQFKCRVVPL